MTVLILCQLAMQSPLTHKATMVDASLLGGRGRLGMASSNQHPGRRPSVVHPPHHPLALGVQLWMWKSALVPSMSDMQRL